MRLLLLTTACLFFLAACLFTPDGADTPQLAQATPVVGH